LNFLRKLILVMVVCISLHAVAGAVSFETSAASFITNQSAANGSTYTNSSELAAVLDEVFAGDIDMFRNANCTNERYAPIGTSYLTGGNLYWVMNEETGVSISGWQCYIYANAVYNKLFGEWIRHGDETYDHSEIVLSGGQREVSFSMFVEAGIRCGAYMRTTANRDGSYNSSAAHSLIILSYTPKCVTYLDGNSDGDGLVRINTRTWAEFNSANLCGRGRYVAHIIQPTAEYYDARYPVAKDEIIPEGENGNEIVVSNGDVTGNGRIDARDYMLVKRYVLQSTELTERQKMAADISGDNRVDARDYMILKQIVLGTYRNHK